MSCSPGLASITAVDSAAIQNTSTDCCGTKQYEEGCQALFQYLQRFFPQRGVVLRTPCVQETRSRSHGSMMFVCGLYVACPIPLITVSFAIIRIGVPEKRVNILNGMGETTIDVFGRTAWSGSVRFGPKYGRLFWEGYIHIFIDILSYWPRVLWCKYTMNRGLPRDVTQRSLPVRLLPAQ